MAVVATSYHTLLFEHLLVDMDCSCTRTGYEVCTCLYSVISSHKKKNLFYKLICVIQMFMRKLFVVQYHPRSILISTYFQTTIIC